MIEAHKLRKTFNKGKVVAVDEVSFAARDGQITGLLGPNGAGKTTTLRMLYTLLKPDSGTMTVDGIDPLADPIGVKAKLGVVPDSRGLYDRLTARENIRYYGKLQGLSKNTIESRVKIKIDPGTQPGRVLRLRGKGLPEVNGYGKGDLLVSINVWMPKNISPEEKKMIEKMSDSDNFTPQPGKNEKGFFNRMKNFFE